MRYGQGEAHGTSILSMNPNCMCHLDGIKCIEVVRSKEWSKLGWVTLYHSSELGTGSTVTTVKSYKAHA